MGLLYHVLAIIYDINYKTSKMTLLFYPLQVIEGAPNCSYYDSLDELESFEWELYHKRDYVEAY